MQQIVAYSITSSARASSIGGHHKSDRLGGAIGTMRGPHLGPYDRPYRGHSRRCSLI